MLQGVYQNRAAWRARDLRAAVLTLVLVVGGVGLTHYGWFDVQSMNFEMVSHAIGFTDDGARTEFTTYRFTDGETVTIAGETRKSAEQARARFQLLAKQAHRIMESNLRLGANQRAGGERLVAIFPNKLCVVLLRDGDELHIIHSRSLPHALEFERRVFERRELPNKSP